jgi:AcrR family transcriptional regulator
MPQSDIAEPFDSGRLRESATKDIILNAAGQVFAEKGFAEATSKEICSRAGVNAAAVNYYFGGKDAPYKEVLRKAHDQILSMQWLSEAAADEKVPPEEKLRDLIRTVNRTTLRSQDSWGIRIFFREIISPSNFLVEKLLEDILPKRVSVRRIISEITHLPEGSRDLEWATSMAALSMFGLVLFPKMFLGAVLPDARQHPEELVSMMHTYILAGLSAVSRKSKA